jgi:16S rRNA (uracil1498-N3)-methyltransferase
MKNPYARLQRLIVADSQYADAPSSGSLNTEIRLTEQQQHYLYRVLRLQTGDQFIAITPQGWWLTEIQGFDQPARLLEAIAVQTELPRAVTLLMALPKTGMDDVVRQATEIGVATIQPILSQRSLLNPSAQKLDRWRRIAQEAAEQSERQTVPEVLPPMLWQKALQTWNITQAACYLCEARGDYPHLLDCLMQQEQLVENDQGNEQATEGSPSRSRQPSIVIAIGSEGGWTPTELEQAIDAGYQPVTLGSRVLRSITAPLVALSVIAAVVESVLGAAQNQQAEKIDKL